MIAVVAYGNPLRGDDGVAWRIAGQIEAAGDPVVTLTLHQLTPELALVLSQADGVVFVDAAVRDEATPPGSVRVRDLRPADPSGPSAGPGLAHHLSPEAVLALARGLYGSQPRAALVTVTGESFVHSERLSTVSRRAAPRAVRVIRRLVRDWSLEALPEGATLVPARIPNA
jgi:hydrogenase maturation protease